MHSVTRQQKIGLACLFTLYLFITANEAAPAQTETQLNRRAVDKALAWIKTQQEPDGGFDPFEPIGPGGFSSRYTAEASLAILSAGRNPYAYSRGRNTPLTFLESHIPEIVLSPTNAGSTLLFATNLKRLGYKPLKGTEDLISGLNASYDPQVGFYGGEHLIYGRNTSEHAIAVLGLASTGSDNVSEKAISYLESRQAENGAFRSFRGGEGPTDNDTNARVAQALVASGRADQAVLNKARDYFISQQNADGGYSNLEGECCGGSTALSTARVIQALIALGADTSDARAFLRSTQRKDGSFSDDLESTYAAIPALLGISYSMPLTSTSTTVGMPRAGSGSADAVVWLALMGVLILSTGTIIATKWRPTIS